MYFTALFKLQCSTAKFKIF